MKSEKTAGEITNFTSRTEAVRKWVLIRPLQSRLT